jgi:hypothetical protein
MNVRGAFVWSGLTSTPTGSVDLTRAQVGALVDDLDSWPAPGQLRLSGFSYNRLGDNAEGNPHRRLEWIRRQPGYNPGPYRQLATVYRSAGHEREARIILIALQHDLRTRGHLAWYARAWNVFMGVTIGHGYRTVRAALVLPILYAVSVLLVSVAALHNDMLPIHASPGQAVTSATCTSRYPCLSRWIYPVDAVIPIFNLHQAEYWEPDAHTNWGHATRDWLYVATILGWAATTLLVVAFTGLARND